MLEETSKNSVAVRHFLLMLSNGRGGEGQNVKGDDRRGGSKMGSKGGVEGARF